MIIRNLAANIFVIQSAKSILKCNTNALLHFFAFQDESRLIMGITYCNICFTAAINIVTKRHVPWKECISLVMVLYSVARNLLDFWQSVNWSIRRCHILKFVPNVRIMAKKDFFLKSIIRMVGGKKKLASNKTVYITFNFWQG